MAPSTALPAWFGKLPGMGDFAHRRLPQDFLAAWDQWLT
ncbi:TagF domain-containing protein, partial [Rhizobium leguminosarum]